MALLTNRLSALEVEDQVTIKDFTLVAQRLEMFRRLKFELADYAVELGTDGRLLRLQLHELGAGIEDLSELLECDYAPEGTTDEDFGLVGLESLSQTELLDPLLVARAIGYSNNEHLDGKLTARGHRQLAQINRLPTGYGTRLIEHFGSLQAVFAASSAELLEVDGVGESRAKIIRDGLIRLAESAFTERID